LSPTPVAPATVNIDPSGEKNAFHADGTTEHVNFVIVERGTEIKFISVDPGAVFAGSIDKQPSGENAD
jgi:hypothetical protein